MIDRPSSFHSMGVYAMKSFGLFIFLFIHISYTKCEEKLFNVHKYEVHIVNGLPDNTNLLEFRCQSKDDDLGYHTLLVGEEFYWKFRDNFFGRTLFFCHFYWQDKDKAFDVYNSHIYCQTLGNHGGTPKCYWLAKADGFYFSNYNAVPISTDWKKVESW
ncbi:hypothetical protein LguiA_030392 [Lonicera macranthoides]